MGLCNLRELGTSPRMGGWMFTCRTLLTHPKEEKYCQGTMGAGGSWGSGTVRASQKHRDPQGLYGQGLSQHPWKKQGSPSPGLQATPWGWAKVRPGHQFVGGCQWGPWAGLWCSRGCSSSFRAPAGKQLPWAGVGHGHTLPTVLPGSCFVGEGRCPRLPWLWASLEPCHPDIQVRVCLQISTNFLHFMS